jgi:signal transduction histidine kinase
MTSEARLLIAEAKQRLQALDVSERSPLHAELLFASALLAFQEERISHAADTLRLALDRFIALGDRRKTALTYSRLGLISHREGLYEAAVEYHLTALILAEEIGYDEVVFRQRINLAQIYNLLQKPSLALDLIQKAKSVMPPTTAPQRQCALYRYAADSYFLLGLLDSAQIFLQRALDITRTPEWRDTAMLAFLRVEYALAAETAGNYALSNAMLDSALALEPNVKRDFHYARLPLLAAKIYTLRARRPNLNAAATAGLYEQAKAMALRAQQSQTAVRLYKMQIAEIIAERYAALGEYDAAYRYGREAAAYRDSLFKNSLESHITAARERIARNAREQEILRLQAENTLNARLQYALSFTAIALLACVALLWNRYRTKKRSGAILSEINTELQRKNVQLTDANSLLANANDELARAKERANEVDKMKQVFIDVVSHEIRTPLTAISAYGELIDLFSDNDDLRHYGDRIKANVRHLLLLFEDMLHVSKMHANRQNAELSQVSIGALCAQIIAVFEEQAAAKNLNLALNVSPSLIREHLLDAAKVRLILFNLVGNAVKFTDQGGVSVSVYPLSTPFEGISVCVQDTGVGIDDKDKNLIFELFSQRDIGVHAKYGGLGLGLTICKNLVDILGGRIFVESARGGGSTFTVELPAQTV